ncbi:Gfo/Idh/MocA family oxidoreductase [Kovacikia minuta CCNUW1]|uniref:Gfo/Idh/MocA family protein n=1 Tax=Kovacikia minuta TaxID=2931930 RepID=UPI001CCA6CC0|nr:Gfo/Idh/MocA family oxidoreductase [Kovacikia minuta]UBF25322.1 Gfo/Idh/MocA family oxidoreductase [Kovacikia minuta CCNUW1]
MPNTASSISFSLPLRVGLVGTGYAAKLRAEALRSHPQAKLIAVAGHTPESTQEFSQIYGGQAVHSWGELIRDFSLDLLIICTINRDHGVIARMALEAGIHVVVEYPLALALSEAEALIALAKSRNKLLHVEHIELMGGIHQALKATLPKIGKVFYARYVTVKPERPAPQRWTYDPDLFGFPLIGALSRLHRLTDLFGKVSTVNCQTQFWQPESSSPFYAACLCTAQLRFQSGLLAEVTYGKGETLWRSKRRFEVQGEQGAVILDGDQGMLVQANGDHSIEVKGRRGLFAKDTALVLDHLLNGDPLYVTPEESLYTLKVADAARRSADTGQTIEVA